MTDAEAAEAANAFWDLAGRSEPYPRSLESSISWALPVALFKVPHLGLSGLHAWLTQRNLSIRVPGPDRPLRACLLAKGGRGMIVVDGSDPDDERRLSIAHEVAHFLLDYMYPRQRALQVLGDNARGVLDGERAPTLEERLTGVLRGVTLGVYSHLTERSEDGHVEHASVLEAEDRADRLALELLAPRPTVLEQLSAKGVSWADEEAETSITELLVQHFGLPLQAARTYGRSLVVTRRAAKTFREWLGAK